MKKTLPFLASFLCLFFVSTSSVNAQANLIDSIVAFFTGKTSTYISQDPSIDINEDLSTFTQYSSNSKYDYTHRAISDNSRLINRGQHIVDIINNKYAPFGTSSSSIYQRDDKVLTIVCGDSQCYNSSQIGSIPACQTNRPLRISEVAYFYLTQNSSTSYEAKDNQIISVPFDDSVKAKLINTYQDKIVMAQPSCYQKAYNLIPITPKSNDAQQSPKNTSSSDQLTNVEKTTLPDKLGSSPVPLNLFESIANFFDGGNTEKVKENYYRENQMLQSFTPESQKKALGSNLDTDNDSLRSNFKNLMRPDKWQEGTIDGDDSNLAYNNGSYNNIDLSTFIDGIEFYIFENPGGSRLTQRYDLGIVDRSRLQDVPSYLRAGSKTQVDERIIPAYEAMYKAARASGISESELKLISGYRSVAEQQVLWESYPASQRCDGTNHPCYVARPGSSPHHTGRAIDIVVNGGTSTSGIDGQKASAAYQWLQSNASKFGFYNYEVEPWHWEYNPKTP